MNKYLTHIIIVIVIFVGGFFVLNSYIYNEKQADPEPVVIEGKPTDFVEVGTMTSGNPGDANGAPILVYEKPGQPALTRDLVFDILSSCMRENNALPCVAMSQTFDVAFGEKRVVVEGIETDSGVLVRKIRTLREDEQNPVIAGYGSVFISWPQARIIIENCQATQVMQTHALDVYITLDDERRVRTVEPNIDEVFNVLNSVQDSCPQIPIATE